MDYISAALYGVLGAMLARNQGYLCRAHRSEREQSRRHYYGGDLSFSIEPKIMGHAR